MKKLIYGACAALLLAASACSKSGDTASTQVPDKLVDSVSSYFGHVYGGYVLGDYQRYAPERQDKANKQAVIKGIQLALNNMDDEGTVIGMQIGGQLASQLKGLKEQGINVDKALLMKEFTKMFMSDSIDMSQLQESSAMLDNMMNRIQNMKNEADKAKESDFMEQIKAENPDIKTSESGLSYVISAPGEAPMPADTSVVVVNYVGKLADGTVFDQSPEGQPATFGVNQVIPGFREGLKMLGKGGKATLYIPGNLAYGEQGVPQAGIGPNAMLIFDIEVVDVK
ncbi:MAG: FKBP-type peptidyl-prolyl cis-trans isomerase [Muribaculaceae bacterium]